MSINLETISTGSKGNCYLLEINKTPILLDCGIPIQQIRKFLFNRSRSLSDVVFCFVSHEHKDHCKSLKQLLELGVKVITSEGTYKLLNLQFKPHNLILIRAFEKISITNPNITCNFFPLVHDALEPLGLVIDLYRAKTRFIYITDTSYVPFSFKNITHLAIECNYNNELLKKSEIHPTVKKRILKTHLSLDALLLFLKRNKSNMPNLQKIWVLHLSDTNSNAEIIKNRIKKILPSIKVIIC